MLDNNEPHILNLKIVLYHGNLESSLETRKTYL